MKRFSLLMFLALVFLVGQAYAQEQLGLVKIDDLLLRPQFIHTEAGNAEFSLGETKLSAGWYKDNFFSGHFSVGTKNLINYQSHFEEQDGEEIGIVEAYAQIDGVYGQIRMGLVPLEYAVEGKMSESQLTLPRSLLFQRRAVGLRDLGFSYRVENNNFYSRLTVHNGEAGKNKDGRMWVTASWGWANERNIDVGASAMTGSTKPTSTSVSSDTLAGVNKNQEAQWRLATFYVNWFPNRWRTILEVTKGELEQNKIDTSFNSGHIDINYQWSDTVGLVFRYDQFENSTKVANDVNKEVNVGFSINSKNSNSAFYVIGKKVIEEDKQIANDQLLLIWKMSPLIASKGVGNEY